MTRGEGRSIQGFGRCIYCGAIGDLRREHVIPYALGGNIVILDASCKTCAEITGAFEGHCAGRIYGALRGVLNFPTRNKKVRALGREITIDPRGRSPIKRRVPYDVVPTAPLVSPVLPRPGILAGQPSKDYYDGLTYKSNVITQGDTSRVSERLGIPDGTTVAMRMEFPLGPFLRMLAKIGHCLVVERHGLDSFQPVLVPYILGRDNCLPDVVGGAEDVIDRPEIPTDTLHACSIGVYYYDEIGYVSAHIQLFRNFDMPGYEVIVGLVTPEQARRLLEKD